MSVDDVTWTRSSFCASGACVLVARAGDVVLVWDSKLGAPTAGSPVQQWNRELWEELLYAVREDVDHAGVERTFDDRWEMVGEVVLGIEHQRHEPLTFTVDEWRKFRAGVLAGEFDWDGLASWSDQPSLPSEGPVGDGAAVLRGGGAPIEATGTDGVADLSVPVAAHCGPNVAAFDVPAGRPTSGDLSSPGETGAIATSGRPGPTVLERAYFVAMESGCLSPDVATWVVEGLHDAGLLVDEPAVSADELLRRGAAPLVPGDPPPDATVRPVWASCSGTRSAAGTPRRAER